MIGVPNTFAPISDRLRGGHPPVGRRPRPGRCGIQSSV
jgi:hypothetical protein